MERFEKFIPRKSLNSFVQIGDTVTSVRGNDISVTQILKVVVKKDEVHIVGLGANKTSVLQTI